MQATNKITEYKNVYDLVSVDPTTNPPAEMRIMLVVDPETEPAGCVYIELRHQHSFEGTPMVEWHGRRYSWELPYNIDPRGLRGTVENELGVLIDRVVAGYSCEWDGNNHVGHSTRDAQEAEEEIGFTIECGGLGYPRRWAVARQ